MAHMFHHRFKHFHQTSIPNLGRPPEARARTRLANKLVKIAYKTDKFTYFTPPTADSGSYSVSVDKTHNAVWFNEQMADKLARFDPHTNAFVEYSLPTTNSNVRRIQVDLSRPNRIWFFGGGISYDKLG